MTFFGRITRNRKRKTNCMKPSYTHTNRPTAFALLLAALMIVTQVLMASAQEGGEI